MTGTIIDVLPGDKFKIELQTGLIVEGYISGKIRKNKIRILLGDQVDIELSVYDLSKGRIIYRYT